MRSVRYSLLALTVLVGSTMTTGARAQEREHRFSPETKSLPAQATGDQAKLHEFEYQHRMARLRRLQHIARENDNKERLERLDRLFDKIESKRHRRLDARRDHRSQESRTPEARAQLHDRLKSGRADKARQGIIDRHQDRHELRDTVVKHRRQDTADHRYDHRQATRDHRDNHRQKGVQRRENHRDAAPLRRDQHQEARQENLGKHHETVNRDRGDRGNQGNRGNRGNRGVRQHRQGNNLDASHNARQNQHGKRVENVANHRGQKRQDPSSTGYRRSSTGNRQLASHIRDRRQNHQNPITSYRKPISKKPAHKYRSQRKLDDEIRRTITSKNANKEFERLMREIEGGP